MANSHNPSQARRCTPSQTVGTSPINDASDLSASPPNLQETAPPTPTIPHKSSKRNICSATRDAPKPLPRRSSNILTRPLPKSQTSSCLSIGHRNPSPAQSSSGSVVGIAARFQGDSPIRKGGNSTNKLGHSLTSALVASQGFKGAASDSLESSGPLKKSVSRSKTVFAKFTGVLIDHFGPKASRRRGKPEGSRTQSAASDNSSKPIVHDLPLERLTSPQLSLPSQERLGTMLDSQREAENMKKEKVKSLIGRDDANRLVASKRLTVVDEDTKFQSGQPLDDPFSESSSSGQSSTEFEARLRSGQGSRDDTTPMDPFQAERILDTSVDAVLTTPPVGCSTPRRQSRMFSRCGSPTRKSHDCPDDTSDLISLTPAKPLRRTKANILRECPLKVNIASKLGQANNGGVEKKNPVSSQKLVSSDSTRLSSFPPGSTIRRVPRSIGRLKDAPVLPVATAEETRRQPLARKKHPSPNKGQLEMFGQYMEKNLALGVFKDSDELGMSFSSPQGTTATLSPRDTTQLIHSPAVSNPAVSNVDLLKDCSTHSSRPGLSRSYSRIPQPVRQLSRSQTDTAVARDFYPAEKGDSTMDDLQWDSSAYKIGHRCNHCGSMNQIL